MNLDNRMSTQPSVQTCHPMMTTNGCKVTLEFSPISNPQINRDVAEMLLAAFQRKRGMNHEASLMSVQSIHQGTGRSKG